MRNIGLNIVLCGRKISLTPTGGYQTITEYEGTRDAIEGYAFSLPFGLSWFIDDSEKPKCKLIVSTPYLDSGNTTPEAPTEIWELPGNTLTKDIYEHPKSVALGVVVTSTIRKMVQDMSDGLTTEQSTTITALDEQQRRILNLLAIQEGVSSENALALRALVLKGTTQYQVSQYVLRHTRVVGQKNAVTLVYSGVEKLYTVAQINVEDPIPASLVFTIGNIVTPTVQTGYLWRWLKQTPSVKVVGAGRIEITQEWWLEQWSTFVYDTLT